MFDQAPETDMRLFPTIAAAIALAAGPAIGSGAAQAADADGAPPKTTAQDGVGVAQTLENIPGTSVPAVAAGVGAATAFTALALGLGSSGTTTTTSTTGTN